MMNWYFISVFTTTKIDNLRIQSLIEDIPETCCLKTLDSGNNFCNMQFASAKCVSLQVIIRQLEKKGYVMHMCWCWCWESDISRWYVFGTEYISNVIDIHEELYEILIRDIKTHVKQLNIERASRSMKKARAAAQRTQQRMMRTWQDCSFSHGRRDGQHLVRNRLLHGMH